MSITLMDFDAKLITSFIEANYEAFQYHLEKLDIEGSEAELILNSLKKGE